MNKQILNLIIASVILIGFSGCDKKQSENNNTLTKVTVAQWGQEKYLIYLPLYVAMEQGYFKKHGLDIKLKFSGNDDQVFATVIKGDAAFGVGDPIFAAIAQEKGFPARVIGTLVSGVAIWGVTKNQDMKVIENPSELAGLRIGTFPEPSTNYTLIKNLIQKENLQGTKIIQSAIGSEIALLESDEADMVMQIEPLASISEAKGYKIVYSSPKFHGKFAFTGITTTKDYLDANKVIAQGFVKALDEAMQASHANPKLSIDVAVKLFPKLDKKIIENAINRMLEEETYPKHVAVDKEGWDNAVKIRKSLGDIKSLDAIKDRDDNSYGH